MPLTKNDIKAWVISLIIMLLISIAVECFNGGVSLWIF